MTQIRIVKIAADTVQDIAPLLRAYLSFLKEIDAMDCGGDLLQTEIEQLDGCYTGAGEGWFAAYHGATAIGCAALHRLTPEAGEICRMYMHPDWRGQGIARRLLEAVIAEATGFGYTRLHLDTFKQPDDARHLYQKLGFLPCAPYYEGPVAKLLFFEKPLPCS